MPSFSPAQQPAQKSSGPFLSIQPGDIFSSSPQDEPPTLSTQPRFKNPQPQFTGHALLRIRQDDRRLADNLIKKLGSADNALLRMATFQTRKTIEDLSATRIMQALIERGADVNYQTEKGVSPLLAAVMTSNISAAAMLIANGANVNLAHDYLQDQKLNLAGIPSLLMSECKLTYPVLETRSLKMLDLLIKEGADVNAIGTNQNTQQKFSVFDRLGMIAAQKIKILMRGKPTEEPASVALHNTMRQVRKTYPAPWIWGSQVHQLEDIKLLLKSGALPTPPEKEKLNHLLEVSQKTCQRSGQYIPYPQKRLQESARQLQEIHVLLDKIKQKATLDADRLSESIVYRSVKHKLSTAEYLQTLKDCLGLRKNLQVGADPTYVITQLTIMRQNNKEAFGSVLPVEDEKPRHDDGQNDMPTSDNKPVFKPPTLKRTSAMAFPTEAEENIQPKKSKQEQP